MIPKGWEVCSINELEQYITSGSRGWAQYYSDSGNLFVRITNLTRKTLSLDLSDSKYVVIPEDNNEGKRTRLKEGDILISITADLGIIGFIENQIDNPIYINQHIALLRISDDRAYNKFIAYQMSSEAGHKQFLSLNDSGAKSGLNLDSIRRFKIAIPPLSEQRKIAEILGAWDEAIDLLEKLIISKHKLKQGLMQKLLTGKKRFKEFEDSEWEEFSIKDLCKIGRGRVISKVEIEKNLGVYPVYSSQTSNNGEMGYLATYDFEGEYVTWTTDGANAGTIFYRNGKFNCTNVCGTLQSTHKNLNMRFLAYQLSMESYKYVSYTLANPKLMNKEMGQILLRLPSLPEQEKIASILSAADEKISTLEKQLAAYKQQKRGLMQQLLTGKVRT